MDGEKDQHEGAKRVFLHSSTSIAVAGEHLQGGRTHTVPAHVAQEIVSSARGRYATEEDEAREAARAAAAADTSAE
jgi:hypothetical protein